MGLVRGSWATGRSEILLTVKPAGLDADGGSVGVLSRLGACRMDSGTSGAGPIRSEFADDPDMAELVLEFVESMPERAASLREAFESSDREGLRRMAHQLKGACGGYGFGPVGEAAGALESGLRSLDDGEPLGTIRSMVDELVSMCDRVRR